MERETTSIVLGCSRGDHNLEEIISWGPGSDQPTVRWCKDCGSVVVDKDFDGRTNAGAVMPMKFPRLLHLGMRELQGGGQ